ncbi:MAG: sigma-70 family RNA polymerase sigma factor [Alphaproteobacteria bacterium]
MAACEEDDDESLVARICERDHRAFATLVRRHTDRFYACAWRMCGNDAQAEDIVQDAFLKLWARPDAFKPDRGARFTTWFTRVVTNLAIDTMRRKKPLAAGDALDTMAAPEPDAEKLLAKREEADTLEHAIQALPSRQKAALNLCFYEGLSNKEAAAILGIRVKALESLLMRAKGNVRDTLARMQNRTKRYG